MSHPPKVDLIDTRKQRFPRLATSMNVEATSLTASDAHYTSGSDAVDGATSAPESSMRLTGRISIRHNEAFADEHMPDTGYEVEDFKMLTWRLTNWNTLKKCVSSPEFECGGHLWRLSLYPFGNSRPLPNTYVSLYLDHMDNQNTTESWHVCAQIAFVISNRNNPQIYTVKVLHHRFTPEGWSWGFLDFSKRIKLTTVQKSDTRPTIENDSVDVTVFVKVLKDPTGFLWHDFLNYDSKKETGYVGLKNQGATDPMNIVLLFLFFTYKFRRAVYQIPTENDNATESVSLALQKIFYHLQTSDQAVDTNELTKAFGWKPLDPQDAFEFLRILFDKLESALKGTQAERVIARLFTGKMKSYIKLINVNNVQSQVENFIDIELDVNGFKTLDESFRNHVADMTLNGDNKHPTKGSGLQDTKQGISFISFPPVLHIRLRRHQFDLQKNKTMKISDRHEYPSEIDLAEYLDESADRSQSWRYKLHSVLVHSGNQYHGRYFAFIMPENDGRWLKYDGDLVSPVIDREVFENSYGGKRLSSATTTIRGRVMNNTDEFRTAYMLKYIRITDLDTVFAPLTEDEIPAHLRNRLWKENILLEAQKCDLEGCLTVKVATDENFRKHQGFDLANFNDTTQAPTKLPTFQVRKQELYLTFKSRVAQKLGLYQDKIRLWVLINRQNKTVRLDTPIIELDSNLCLYHIWNNIAFRQSELHLYMELLEDSTKLHDRNLVTIFLKYFNATNQSLKGVGMMAVKGEQKVSDLIPIINKKMTWALETSLKFYEEIKPGMIEHMKSELTFTQSEIQNGDIICFQQVMSDKEMQDLESLGMYTNPIQFYDFLQNCVTINFHPKFDPVDDNHPEFNLILNKKMGYDTMSAKVGEFLRKDPNKIRFTATHPPNTHPGIILTPKPNFSIQEILYSPNVSSISITVLYEILDGTAIFSPCTHVEARYFFQLRTSIAQPGSYDMPSGEVQRSLWKSIRYSCCNCPWRVLLNHYKIYSLLGKVNGPWELFDAIKDWFDNSGKMTLPHQLNNWSSEETNLFLTIIDHIISVMELEMNGRGASTFQLSLCLSWLRKITRKTGILPSSLILKDVKRIDVDPVQNGGFADIYKGTYGEDQVALKVIRVTTTTAVMNLLYKEVFHEALHWKHLRHEHIAPFFGITQDLFKSRIGLVSPWMDNGNILQYLENNPQADRNILLTHSAKGLSYLHSQTPALVHGDIKAGNILVDDNGKACLTDFGLISISETQHMQTTFKMGEGGTLRWMAPELVDPSRERVPKSRSSDIYAFGMTIIEVFSGLPPFAEKNEFQVLLSIVSGARPARPNNTSLISPLSNKLWEVAQRWDTEPERRPAVEKLLSDLQEISG